MKLLFYILPIVFFLQTRLPIANQFHGNDYEIVYVYLRDVVVLLFTCSVVCTKYKELSFWVRNNRGVIFWLVTAVLFSGLSAFFSSDMTVSLYKTSIIALYGTFSLAFAWYVYTKNELSAWLRVTTVTLVVITIMALFEVTTGHSLGFWILGNWEYSTLTPGIAKLTLFGITFLRPYTIFPHPNVLGGVALVLGILFVKGISKDKKLHKLHLIGMALCWTLVLISFSRSAWLAGICVVLAYVLGKKKRMSMPVWVWGVCVLSIVVMGAYFSQTSLQEPSVSERIELFTRGVDMIRSEPLFGVGNGNFTVNLAHFRSAEQQVLLQPVHIVWLLILAEIGIIGGTSFFIGWLYLLYKSLLLFKRRNDNTPLLLWIAITSTSLFDHYWWSLPVGLATWCLMVGVMLTMLQSLHHEEVTHLY